MNSNTPESCIRLVNMMFYAHHGVHREEHFVGSKYEVDAEMYCNYSQAARNDDIAETIDYRVVYEKIRHLVTQKKFYLIEAVAHAIAMEFLETFHQLNSVTIKVRKRNPPIGGVCDYAEAVYSTQRT
ncbi:MAG: dihydroneopterin aldolase [Chlorobium phaeobacteroides]|uniref:7,8-dihydroneopterin aldolase n=1 Tax=Chlorobium phaeobacteroides (strain BS1) TaxID=331678 RepID=B3ENK7_CHLPB|nr:dihydroneopterin aldolase [Chlorobium phaeobacteroides]